MSGRVDSHHVRSGGCRRGRLSRRRAGRDAGCAVGRDRFGEGARRQDRLPDRAGRRLGARRRRHRRERGLPELRVSRGRLGDRHRRHEGRERRRTTGETATASSTSSASNISLFDGEITADSVAAHASASGGTRQAGGAFGGTSVANLQALGRPHAFGRAGLGDWGYLVIARHAATRTTGFDDARLRRRLDRARHPPRDRATAACRPEPRSRSATRRPRRATAPPVIADVGPAQAMRRGSCRR